jgi:hypothetical protein
MAALNLCHASMVESLRAISIILANNDGILHKILVRDEVNKISDHQCVIVEWRVSVVCSRAVLSCRSFGCKIGSVSCV